MVNQQRASQIILPAPPTTRPSKSRSGKWVALLIWGSLLAGYWNYSYTHHLPPLALLNQLQDWFLQPFYGPLIFIFIFALQPLVFFPSALMGIAGGYLYGPWWGWVYALAGANGAGLVSYLAGRCLGNSWLDDNAVSQLLARYSQPIRKNGFETILILHLIFVPYDAVNYVAGLLRVPLKPYLLATCLGALPGLTSLVWLGASIEGQLAVGEIQLSHSTLLASAMMLIISLGVARLVKR